ncbi:MAG TPA: hypothetical protein K8V47_00880 [Candidatus Amulumruptor caecigallinarius]|uniref:Uncharacterized protein n=1 Tax=Candidatus Amulumruptor caecigallinarius TaxID=2109911 RepID=A0A921JHH6_9BACT|nr:hypothetical protein [Candidatus Amulumruptor caecigallinarius]
MAFRISPIQGSFIISSLRGSYLNLKASLLTGICLTLSPNIIDRQETVSTAQLPTAPGSPSTFIESCTATSNTKASRDTFIADVSPPSAIPQLAA